MASCRAKAVIVSKPGAMGRRYCYPATTTERSILLNAWQPPLIISYIWPNSVEKGIDRIKISSCVAKNA